MDYLLVGTLAPDNDPGRIPSPARHELEQSG